MENVEVNLGERIRRIRKENNLSIQKLATKSKVSPATIYKIERNEMMPTITVLMKIAGALYKKAGFFVDNEDALSNVGLVEKMNRLKLSPLNSKIQAERISSRIINPLLEAGIMTIDINTGSGDEQMTHVGEELDICLEGEIEFKIRDEVCILEKGSSIHFKSEIPHSWRNVGKKPAKMIYILNPPPLI
jgi:transcriptional regulator with XRE-family HTH domain